MKKLKLLFNVLTILITISVYAQEKYPVMTFEKTNHDFGTIHEKDVVKTIFKFKNTGDVPLIISNMKASCGCTVANYSKEPIQPGGTGQFTVTFNSAHKPHKQHKRITITCNTKKHKEFVNITANVIPDPKLEKIRQQRYEQMKKRREEQMKKRKEADNKRKEQLSIAKQNEKQFKEKEKNVKKEAKKAKADVKKAKKIRKLNEKIDKANKKINKLKTRINKYQKKLNKLK